MFTPMSSIACAMLAMVWLWLSSRGRLDDPRQMREVAGGLRPVQSHLLSTQYPIPLVLPAPLSCQHPYSQAIQSFGHLSAIWQASIAGLALELCAAIFSNVRESITKQVLIII